MEKRKTRSKYNRGISPLVSTMILITAAILGGMMVYNYFQSSVTKITASSQDLSVEVKSVYTENGKVVYVAVTDLADKPVTISRLVILDGSSNPIIEKSLNETIAPGEKKTLLENTRADASIVYLEYNIGKNTMKTPPQRIP